MSEAASDSGAEVQGVASTQFSGLPEGGGNLPPDLEAALATGETDGAGDDPPPAGDPPPDGPPQDTDPPPEGNDDETPPEDGKEGRDGEDEDAEAQAKGEGEGEGESDDADPTFKAIKDYDPKFFKKFPKMGQVLTDHKAFRDFFPTDELFEAGKRALDEYSSVIADIHEGDLTQVLGVMHRSNPGRMGDLVTQLMSDVRAVDPDAWTEYGHRFLRATLRNLRDAAKTSADPEANAAAVEFVAEMLFEGGQLDEDGDSADVLAERARHQTAELDRQEAGVFQRAGVYLRIELQQAMKAAGLPETDILADTLMERIVGAIGQDRVVTSTRQVLKSKAQRAGRYTPRIDARLEDVLRAHGKKAIESVVPQLARQLLGQRAPARPKGEVTHDAPGQRTRSKTGLSGGPDYKRMRERGASLEDVIAAT